MSEQPSTLFDAISALEYCRNRFFEFLTLETGEVMTSPSATAIASATARIYGVTEDLNDVLERLKAISSALEAEVGFRLF